MAGPIETGELVATGALALGLELTACGCGFCTGRALLWPATLSSTGIGPSGRELHATSKPTRTTQIAIKL